jgi:hypothetical protein
VASLRRKADRLRDFRLDVERDGRRGTIQIGG